MLKIARPLFYLIILGFFLGNPPAAMAGGQLLDIVVHSPGLEGNGLGDSPERSALVYLPPGYQTDTDQHYPVLYLLHGFGGNHRLWVGDGYLGPMYIKSMVDDLIESGRIGEMIVAMPDASNAYMGSFYINSTLTGNWEDFIATDLVAHMDAEYRTNPTAAGRGIAGHSMGGQGAMTIGLKHPDVFSAVYSMSGNLGWDYWEEENLALEGIDFDGEPMAVNNGELWRNVLNLTSWDDVAAIPFSWNAPMISSLLAMGVAYTPDVDASPFLTRFPFVMDGDQLIPVPEVQQLWHSVTPVGLVEAGQVDAAQLRHIRFDVGTADQFVGIRVSNQELSTALTAAGVDHTYEAYEGEHGSATVERLETQMLPFFSAVLDAEFESTAVSRASWAAIKEAHRP
jgi:S-formylglutathione hydrolase